MELYEPYPAKRSAGLMVRARLILLVAAIAILIGAAIWWFVCPWASAAWRALVVPLVQRFSHALGA